MSTLQDYAELIFPNHAVDVDVVHQMTSHTAVAEVFAAHDAVALERSVREAMPGIDLAKARVSPSEPTIMPTSNEDRGGSIDVPRKRLAVSAAAGVVVGILIGVAAGTALSLGAAVIVGVFAAIIGGLVASIAGGGARFAGERGWEQPNRPAEPIYLVAAFADDEEHATQAAEAMERTGVTEVRIVNEDGAWHNPLT
ncbi:MAG TPA: hypothetical protein VGM78_00395 [Ilumatobacteraceae bacterium]